MRWGSRSSKSRADVTQHPNYVMGGDVASNLPYMGVGGLTAGARAAARTAYESLPANANRVTRVLAHPYAAPIGGAGFGAATDVASQLDETGTVDPTRLAIATVGGAAMSHETAIGSRVAGIMPNLFRSWRGRVAPELHPETPADTEQLTAFGSFLAEHGITDPANVTPEQVTSVLNARRGVPGPAMPLQSAEGQKGKTPLATVPEFWANENRLGGERDAVASGEMDPGAASTAGRIPLEIPPVIPVTPAGQAIVDPGAAAGRDKFGGGRGLPVSLGEPTPPTGLWPGQIEAAQERVANDTYQPPIGQPSMEPNQFVAAEGRLPQTGAQRAEQDQSMDAFDKAGLQRYRSVTPGTHDTRVGGRPEGANPQDIMLDVSSPNNPFPVREVGERQFVKVGKKMVEHAQVERYDPITGKPVEGAEPYLVPVSQTTTKTHMPQMRMGQEFQEASKGPIVNEGLAKGQMFTPEQPRAADHAGRTTAGVQGEPKKTFRTTEQDNAEGPLPSGTEGRSQMPPQPEGPAPGRQRSAAEEEYIQRERAKAEERARQDWGGNGTGAKGRDYTPGDDAASNTPKGLDAEGRWHVDERGYVVSKEGGPVRFPDTKDGHKQAAKWINKVGHKQGDQIFDRANHPSGKGITIQETGRGENFSRPEPEKTAEPPPSSAEGASAAARDTAPGVLPPPREAPIFTGKTKLGKDQFGASVGGLGTGNRRQLMVDPAGGHFWGDYIETDGKLGGGDTAPVVGEHADHTPALFANSKEARAAAEATPQSKTQPGNKFVPSEYGKHFPATNDKRQGRRRLG